MAITYTPVAIRGEAVSPIVQEVMFANKTVGENYVTFADDVKAGTIITEADTTVVGQLYTGDALTPNGSLNIKDREIIPAKVEYRQDFKMEDLRQSRFNQDMTSGAWNIESNEFNSQVLAMVGPKVSADAETKFWSAISTASKAVVAGYTPAAGQGSITAATQTKVAALTADAAAVDGVLSRVLNDGGVLGAYIKVASSVITAANIAAEYAKIYLAIPSNVLEDSVSPPCIFAPRSHRQFMRTANNSVGAASNQNFTFENETATSKVYYNGVEVKFVPITLTDTVYVNRPAAIFWSTDSLADVAAFETGKVDNAGDKMFVRSIYTLGATVTQQFNGVLYGG